MPPAIRYLPQRAFPPYTYVPGQAPHPIRDPAGHMHRHQPTTAELHVENWWNCEDYLWGIDLFNHGYYWEAHEAWEGVWHVAGRRGTAADFLKGLIKLAAAGVKTREGSQTGRQRHLRRAIELVQATNQKTGSPFMGLHLDDLLNDAAANTAERDIEMIEGDPPIVFSFSLLPEQTP